jgi:hypothetical protein
MCQQEFVRTSDLTTTLKAGPYDYMKAARRRHHSLTRDFITERHVRVTACQ